VGNLAVKVPGRQDKQFFSVFSVILRQKILQAFRRHYYSDSPDGGEGRNRTMSSPTTSLNILIYRGKINADFTGVQAVSVTIRPLPDLTRHLPAAYSVIEEIVEGFVEGFLTGFTN
jgi:hypothetical protein